MTDAAIIFLRRALAEGSRRESVVIREARAAGISIAELNDAQQALNCSTCYESVLRLDEAACIVCDRATVHVERHHGLPLCPSCPSPIRTWQWKHPRTDGKRGLEELTVAHRADTWRIGVNERNRRPGGQQSSMATCSTIFERLKSRRPQCTDPVVWKVARRKGSSRTVYYAMYCDADLPDECRPKDEGER